MTAPGAAFELALRGDAEWMLRLAHGGMRTLDFARWLGPAEPADERVLQRAEGPVLDIGCGPGRHVHALARRGVLALGVDVSAGALALARARGASVLEGSIFHEVPRPGEWASALLLDGNIGIGGDPGRLLRRARELLVVGGAVLVETDAPGTPTRPVQARLEGPGAISDWFPWALVGADGLGDCAAAAGLAVRDRWEDGGRWFAELG
jgi:SAM-dependent methyltransferase